MILKEAAEGHEEQISRFLEKQLAINSPIKATQIQDLLTPQRETLPEGDIACESLASDANLGGNR